MGYHPREPDNKDQGLLEILVRVDKGQLLVWVGSGNSAECLLFSIAAVQDILG